MGAPSWDEAGTASVRRIAERAAELPTHERGPYLDEVCAGNVRLRSEIDSIVASLTASGAGGLGGAIASTVSLPPGPGHLAIGRRFAHYRVLSRIGQGGMGAVYKAMDLNLGRQVALKIVSRGSGSEDSPELRRRFAREARAASALNHPNIVTIYEYGSEGGVDFIAMEYIEGITLDRLLAGRRGGAEVSLATLIEYARQTAVALDKAHAAGIVHRDLKPGNIMVTADGVAKVLDFGLARRQVSGDGESHETAALTRAGVVLGTPAYMSPEQALGEPVDSASDVFSFGIILYQIACGRRPFEGGSAQATAQQIVLKEPAPVQSLNPELPPALCTLIEQCLRKDKNARLKSLGAAAGALAAMTPQLGDRNAGAQSWAARALPRLRTAVTSRLALRIAIGVAAFVLLIAAGANWTRLADRVLPKSSIELVRQGQLYLDRYDRKGHTDLSIASFQKAVDVDSENAQAHAGLAEAYVRKQLESPDPVWGLRAGDSARRALELNDLLAAAHVAHASVLLAARKTDEALAASERATQLDPRNSAAWRNLGIAFERKKDFGRAEECYRKSIALAPDQWQGYLRQGYLLHATGRTEEAIRKLEEGSGISPDNAVLHRNLGVVYHAVGRDEEAASAFQRSLEVAPSQVGYSNLGTILFYLGRYRDAVNAFDKASRIDANAYQVWVNLGDAYRWTPGQETKAPGAYRTAIRLAREEIGRRPADTDLQTTLAALLAKTGDCSGASQILGKFHVAQTESAASFKLGIAHERCSERRKALDYVFRAAESGHPLRQIRNDPELTDLRRDPEYQRRAAVIEDK